MSFYESPVPLLSASPNGRPLWSRLVGKRSLRVGAPRRAIPATHKIGAPRGLNCAAENCAAGQGCSPPLAGGTYSQIPRQGGASNALVAKACARRGVRSMVSA